MSFGKGFAENLVLQRLASENALKLAHPIFQLLHFRIADHWFVGIHGHRISLAQKPASAIEQVWRNSMAPSRRRDSLPSGIAFLDDLQFAFRCPASPPDVANHQINLSKLVTHQLVLKPVLEPSCLC